MRIVHHTPSKNLSRLPQVIRRPVDIFDGHSALEWILLGRIEEVAKRYEVAFAYQG